MNKFGVGFLYGAYSAAQGKDFELILTVKMETRHHAEGPFGSDFPAISVIIAALWRPEVARSWKFVCNFCVSLEKGPPCGKIFKIMFQKFSPPHRSMLLYWNIVKFVRREIGEIVHCFWPKKFGALQNCRYYSDSAQNLQGSSPTFGSHCSRFIQIGSFSAES